MPLLVFVSGRCRKVVRNTYRDIRVRLARINSFLQERLTGMRIVQLFNQEKREAQRFDELNRSHLDANLRSITVYALYFPAIELLTSIALAILIVAGASRVHANLLSVGTVAAFLQLVRRFFQPLQDLSEKYNILQTAMARGYGINQAGSRSRLKMCGSHMTWPIWRSKSAAKSLKLSPSNGFSKVSALRRGREKRLRSSDTLAPARRLSSIS